MIDSIRLLTRIAFGLLLVLIVLSAVAEAQDDAPVPDTVATLAGIEVTTAVDRAEIFVGDLITYTVTITYDSTYELIPPPLGANLGAFDVKDYQSDLISTLPDGRRQSVSKFVLSTFTTGDYVIPPIPAVFNLPDGSRKAVVSEGVPVKVKSLLSEAVDTVDIRPQKPVYEFPRDMTMYYVWGSVGLVFLTLAVVFAWRYWRRHRERAKTVDRRPPWEIAFEQLAVLKEKGLLGEQRYRQYYFELTEAYRSYLGKMYMVDVLEMTTEEFMSRFRQVSLPGSLYQRSGEFFEHADLVKFAKHDPGATKADSDLETAHNMVELVRSDFVRRNQIDQDSKIAQPQRETV